MAFRPLIDLSKLIKPRLESLVGEEATLNYLSSDTQVSFLPIGSAPDDKPLSTLLCANLYRRTSAGPIIQCSNAGTLNCQKCETIKYCSLECQKRNKKTHHADCNSDLLDSFWRPSWSKQNRQPTFVVDGSQEEEIDTSKYIFGPPTADLWSHVPSTDILNIPQNEGHSSIDQDFKIGFIHPVDIKNLIHTVNNLPEDYSGQLDILLQDMKIIKLDQSLIVLYALLVDDLPIEEAAELVVHLLYSAFLTKPMAAYLYRCIHAIYRTFQGESDPFMKMLEADRDWRASFPIRGGGTLTTFQTEFMIRELITMYTSQFSTAKAQRSMRKVMQNPKKQDYADRFMFPLQPTHRVGITHFRKTGVLLPYLADTKPFSEPNRLMFNEGGLWLPKHSANPLFGWDLDAVRKSGETHGVDPTDLWGSLFFHVKDELIKFASRVQKFKVNITVASCNIKTLHQKMALGKMPPFSLDSFDRLDLSLLGEERDTVNETIENWAPFLRRKNQHSTMLVYFHQWILKQLTSTVETLPDAAKMEVTIRCMRFLGIEGRKMMTQGSNSPEFYSLMESADAFYDHEEAFEKYATSSGLDTAASSIGLRRRQSHRIQPKRIGVALTEPEQRIPELSKEQFYDIFVLGSAEPSMRFVEFEVL